MRLNRCLQSLRYCAQSRTHLARFHTLLAPPTFNTLSIVERAREHRCRAPSTCAAHRALRCWNAIVKARPHYIKTCAARGVPRNLAPSCHRCCPLPSAHRWCRHLLLLNHQGSRSHQGSQRRRHRRHRRHRATGSVQCARCSMRQTSSIALRAQPSLHVSTSTRGRSGMSRWSSIVVGSRMLASLRSGSSSTGFYQHHSPLVTKIGGAGLRRRHGERSQHRRRRRRRSNPPSSRASAAR